MAEDKLHDLAVAVLNIQKEVNVGTIIRTANAAALKEVVIVGRKKWNLGPAIKAQYFTKVTRLSTKEELLDYAAGQSYNLVAVEINEAGQELFEAVYPPSPLIVIGNEGTGVPQLLLEKAGLIVTIPQYGQMECLNAASSAAIVIYDWLSKNNRIRKKQVSGSVFTK